MKQLIEVQLEPQDNKHKVVKKRHLYEKRVNDKK